MPESTPHDQHRLNIERRVRELMINKLRVSPVVLETSDSATPLLGRGIGLDSMEAMSLAVEIEEAFGFAVLDEDLTEELFASFGALTDYIIKQSREDNA
jgi:acyl carrier protein